MPLVRTSFGLHMISATELQLHQNAEGVIARLDPRCLRGAQGLGLEFLGFRVEGGI